MFDAIPWIEPKLQVSGCPCEDLRIQRITIHPGCPKQSCQSVVSCAAPVVDRSIQTTRDTLHLL